MVLIGWIGVSFDVFFSISNYYDSISNRQQWSKILIIVELALVIDELIGIYSRPISVVNADNQSRDCPLKKGFTHPKKIAKYLRKSKK